jgi:hypothetical protein
MNDNPLMEPDLSRYSAYDCHQIRGYLFIFSDEPPITYQDFQTILNPTSLDKVMNHINHYAT